MNRRLILKPGKRFGRLPLWDVSGVRLGCDQGIVFVNKLVPFSPAIAAGLRLDDEIIEVDKASVRNSKLSEFSRYLLQLHACRAEVKVRRQGGERVIIIDLGNDCGTEPPSSNRPAHDSDSDQQKSKSAM